MACARGAPVETGQHMVDEHRLAAHRPNWPSTSSLNSVSRTQTYAGGGATAPALPGTPVPDLPLRRLAPARLAASAYRGEDSTSLTAAANASATRAGPVAHCLGAQGDSRSPADRRRRAPPPSAPRPAASWTPCRARRHRSPGRHATAVRPGGPARPPPSGARRHRHRSAATPPPVTPRGTSPGRSAPAPPRSARARPSRGRRRDDDDRRRPPMGSPTPHRSVRNAAGPR